MMTALQEGPLAVAITAVDSLNYYKYANIFLFRFFFFNYRTLSDAGAESTLVTVPGKSITPSWSSVTDLSEGRTTGSSVTRGVPAGDKAVTSCSPVVTTCATLKPTLRPSLVIRLSLSFMLY